MKRSIIYLLVTVVAVSSCKKWLNVQPESQIDSDQLFSTAQGYEEALDGVYTRCSQGDLYGTELTVGLPDVLALDWSISPGSDYLGYLQSSIYNYKDPTFVSKKDGIWSGLYNAITNDNLLLQHLDSGKVLSSTEYMLIKGEALALRAYLHFDVTRLFAPSYVTAASTATIPYVTTYSNQVTPFSSVSDVLNLCIKDLTQAKALLKQSDPIVTAAYKVGYPNDTAAKETASSDLFLQNRRHRLNYYAVCGELARIYLYMNDRTDALANAMEVINARKFPWADPTYFNNANPQLKDRILYTELLFCWDIPTMTNTMIGYFGSGLNGLTITPDMGATIYEANGVGGEDYRYSQWWTPGSYLSFNKYKRDVDTNLHPLVAPALRLSECYYIAAECTYPDNPSLAMQYVDTVRLNRNIGEPLTAASQDDFMTQLVSEARKEFYGEGQIFYMYKRLNRGIVGPTSIVNAPSNSVFVLPLPVNEQEYGGR